MPIRFNHTIVASYDNHVSAKFWSDILGLPIKAEWGPFVSLEVDNNVTFDFAAVPSGVEVAPQHYAFLVSEDDFDASFSKITERGLTIWADPQRKKEGEINHNDGGRGVYFLDPAGNFLELITVPYGGLHIQNRRSLTRHRDTQQRRAGPVATSTHCTSPARQLNIEERGTESSQHNSQVPTMPTPHVRTVAPPTRRQR